MSAWICTRNAKSSWTATQLGDPTQTVTGVNNLDLEKAIRQTAGYNIWTPLKTSWNMIRPTSAVFVMATAASAPIVQQDALKTLEPSSDETPTEKVVAEVESDDDYTGGLFD